MRITVKFILFLSLVACVCTAAFLVFFKNEPQVIQPTYLNNNFDERVARSIDTFGAGELAQVIAGTKTSAGRFTLTFAGMTDLDTMYEALHIIEKYGIRSTFFLPGAEVAEYSQIVDDIQNAGSNVASYSLHGGKRLHEKLAYDMIEDFVYSSALIERSLNEQPSYLMCNNTQYTSDLLRAAKSSGYEYVIKPSEVLNFQSFSDYETTYNYVKKIPDGSVITIKLEGVLDAEEYGRKLTTAADAATRGSVMASDAATRGSVTDSDAATRGSVMVTDAATAAGVMATRAATAAGRSETSGGALQSQESERERLLDVIEWTCKAIGETQRGLLPLNELAAPGANEAVADGAEQEPEGAQTASAQGPAKSRPVQPSRKPALPSAKPAPDEAEKAAEEAKKREQLETLHLRNADKMAEVIHPVYTIEQAVSYVFYGISSEKALQEVLTHMQALGATGTFFVTASDIQSYPDRVAAILQSGNEIGISAVQGSRWDFYDTVEDLQNTRDMLLRRYGADCKLVMLPYGAPGEILREAVSALSMDLIQPSFSVAREVDEFAVNAEDVMQSRFSSSQTALKRGDIVYFRLDFYKNSDTLPAELARRIKNQFIDPVQYAHDNGGESAYTIKGVKSLLSSSLMYRISTQHSALTAEIHPGHLNGRTDSEVWEILTKYYIGNPNASTENMLPGFTAEQIKQLDTTGRIDTGGQRVMFLTFDDWGDDISLNRLLYVLKKHDTKASFFIKTNYVPNNPNLLRAVAADGHDIASHTVNHMVLSRHVEQAQEEGRTIYKYESLLPEEVGQLEKELVDSFHTLVGIAGDVKNERQEPVVKKYFRAPTLAQSYIGMRTVFDTGYQYSISGDFSTGDYRVRSVAELKDMLVNGMQLTNGEVRTIQNGSIIVMHMTAEAAHTPEALDQFLTENSQKPENERIQFLRLSDYL